MEGFVRQVYLEGLSMFNTTLDIQDQPQGQISLFAVGDMGVDIFFEKE